MRLDCMWIFLFVSHALKKLIYPSIFFFFSTSDMYFLTLFYFAISVSAFLFIRFTIIECI